MNLYEEIDQETKELLLTSLCKRTLAGKQVWENMHYNPIGFLQKDLIYEEKGACISQMLEATTMLNGIEYEVGIFEIIDIPSYKGNISISLYYETEAGENNYDFALSFDTEQYNYADAVELKEIYGNSVIVQLAEALVNVFENLQLGKQATAEHRKLQPHIKQCKSGKKAFFHFAKKYSDMHKKMKKQMNTLSLLFSSDSFEKIISIKMHQLQMAER